jgi:prepilin-type N-terminal cleavage/methylation domain-containing protein
MNRKYLRWLNLSGHSMRRPKNFMKQVLQSRDLGRGLTEMGPGPSFISISAMKNKGFTLVELVVACTLLLMLSTVATTSTFNFVQATANLKAQYNNIQNIMALHSVLVQAKMNYGTDLTSALTAAQASVAANPNNPAEVAIEQALEHALWNWNNLARQNDSQDLISVLINPPTGFPLAPLYPPSRSYLPTSRNVSVMTMNSGNPVTTYVLVQITDMPSLLKAYQLTDSGTPTGNIVATISVGTMLDLGPPLIRPTLPIIDWKSGTPQEIQF